ncbi:hypothetical protein CRUP_008496 [Coryphaenoides rupestris]|nr:hypothetical protein CRUP_008496 [Coryphaenoides rupestris]
MAEISTLTPSTPVLAEPPVAPSIPPPSMAPPKPSSPAKPTPTTPKPSSPAKPTPTTPKSYLYHDNKPLTPPSASPPSARLSPPHVLLTEQRPLPVPDVPTPAEAVSAGVPVSVATAVGIDPLVLLIKQDGGVPAPLDSIAVAPSSTVSHQSEPSDIQAGQQQTASPTSPGLNATPNLYPSVQVAAPNPTAAVVDEAQAAPKQVPVPAPAEPPTSPPLGSTPTPGVPGTTSPQNKSPQSPPPPVPPKPSAGPRSPQHHTPPTITTGGGDIAGGRRLPRPRPPSSPSSR